MLIVSCSFPNRALAQTLAATLLQPRLAACAPLLSCMQSVCRRADTLEHASEIQLQSTTDAAAEAAIPARHPYELPEIVAVEPVAGLDRYLDWIGASSRPDVAS